VGRAARKGREENSEQSVYGVEDGEELVHGTLTDRDGNNEDWDGPDDEDSEGDKNDDSSEAESIADSTISVDEFSLDLNTLARAPVATTSSL
jgi:hypothetical protein